jgi:hypothetical protein
MKFTAKDRCTAYCMENVLQERNDVSSSKRERLIDELITSSQLLANSEPLITSYNNSEAVNACSNVRMWTLNLSCSDLQWLACIVAAALRSLCDFVTMNSNSTASDALHLMNSALKGRETKERKYCCSSSTVDQDQSPFNCTRDAMIGAWRTSATHMSL